MNPKGYFRSQAIFRRLPEMYKQLNELQKEIEELKNKNK
jgi:UDP-3-O-[3-hydroxymyristoyl] glucosamine N-acyltransferase